jgi:adenylyltransferase/sulfurtransferase
MLLPPFGEDGQRLLGEARVAVVGCGALGCTMADLLARAGVGEVHLIDRDVVELTNLQRQTLYTEADAAAGLPKSRAAARRLNAVNSAVRIHAHTADLTARNAERLLGPVLASATTAPAAAPFGAPAAGPGPRTTPTPGARSLMLDATDNFETRYLLNDLSVKHGVALVYGGVVGTRGMQATFRPFGERPTPCLRCIFDRPPPPGSTPTCDTAGVLGPSVVMVAAAQASDALKLILGQEHLLANSLMDLDPWQDPPVHRRLDLGRPRPDCPACALRRFEFLDGAGREDAALCGQDAVQVGEPADSPLDLARVRERLAPHGDFALVGDMLLRGLFSAERNHKGEPLALTLFSDGRAIVRGTTSSTRARTLYARYIGG